MDSVTESAGTYHGRLMLVIVNIVGIINGVMASERTQVEKGRIVVDGVLPLLDFLFGSPWRPFRRARRFFDAEAYVRKYGVDQ
jgi:hypothetical protein